MFSFSVLISLYKGDSALGLSQTLGSVWDRQSIKPQEIILVIDGPIGDTLEECVKLHKEKMAETLHVLRLKSNVGLGIALNEGLKLIKTNYVARIDCDDVANADRFKKQIDFARRHPEVSVFSGLMNVVDYQNLFLYTRKVPLSHNNVNLRAKYSSPIAHPVAFMKVKDILSVGGYPNFRRSQDMVLCAKLIRAGLKIINMPDILGLYKRPNIGFLKRVKLNFSDMDALLYLVKHRYINYFHVAVICMVRFIKSFINA